MIFKREKCGGTGAGAGADEAAETIEMWWWWLRETIEMW